MPAHGDVQQVMAMRDRHEAICTRLKWPVMIAPGTASLLVSAMPGEAQVRVFIAPGIVVLFGLFWAPYIEPHHARHDILAHRQFW